MESASGASTERRRTEDLTGRVPAELGNLTNLQWLSLSHNWVLSGSLPPRRRFPDRSRHRWRLCRPPPRARPACRRRPRRWWRSFSRDRDPARSASHAARLARRGRVGGVRRPDGDALTYAVSWARVFEKRPPRPVIAVATRGRGPRQPARPAAGRHHPHLVGRGLPRGARPPLPVAG